MKIIFCGGAKEVGASCYLIKIDKKNILLDCGIRMTSNKDNLPDFRLIQDNGGVDAIFISHAHTDHTGALPIISRLYPDAKIYMTQPTKDLVKVLLYDSLKIMDREDEIPIYAEKHVEEALDKILCFSPNVDIKPFDDCDITVKFYIAGHVLGASSIYITSKEGSIFYSGDFSGFKQNTIGGASIPRIRPDIALIESTYGDKLHSNRELEENRLIDMVNNVLDNGGKMLIPAFALGRAQEVILILKKAISKHLLKNCHIYVDGLIKDICRAYQQNPNYLRSSLSKKIYKGNDIFFNDTITKVVNTNERNDIIKKDERCIIISSSGMLTGGPSQFYALSIANAENNYIAITGYQDEESPGRKLLDLSEEKAEDKIINIGNYNVNVKCRVGKYGLSAHADMMEILNLINKISPKNLILIHGGPDVIKYLGTEVQKEFNINVYAPNVGDILEFNIKKPRKQLKNIELPTMNMSEELNIENAVDLWKFIYTKLGTGALLSTQDLIRIWYGSDRIQNNFQEIIEESIYFENDKKWMFLYHALDINSIEEAKKPKIMEVNKMMKLIDSMFTPEMGVYKRGANQEESKALIYFNFPQVAREKYENLFEEFEKQTGWKVELNNNINTSVIEREVMKILPTGVFPKGKISYNLNKNTVLIKIDEHVDNNYLKKLFFENTGMNLLINNEDLDDIGIEKELIKEKSQELMEQNKVLNLIDELFADKKHKPYKKSIKMNNNEKYIELSFVSYVIGIKYMDILKEVSQKSGWPIVVSKSCNQNEIINYIYNICSEYNIKLSKTISLYTDKNVAKIRPVEIDDEKKDAINKIIFDSTGFKIEI